MNYLWYSNGTCITGKALAEELNIKRGMRLPPRGTKFVICWGARLPNSLSYAERHRLEGLTYLNNVFAIDKSSNKYKALKKMSEVCNVPKSYTCYEIDSALRRGDISFPLVGRKNHHQGGTGFYLCLQERDLELAKNHAHYFVEYIKCTREFRVHVFKGEVIRISKKVPKEEENPDLWLRSLNKGWKFIDIQYPERLNPKIASESKKAIASLGLDFGATDVILSDNGRVYILEVNTGVGLCPKGIELYTKMLKSVMYKKRSIRQRWLF